MKAWLGHDVWEDLYNVFYAKTRGQAKQLVAS